MPPAATGHRRGHAHMYRWAYTHVYTHVYPHVYIQVHTCVQSSHRHACAYVETDARDMHAGMCTDTSIRHVPWGRMMHDQRNSGLGSLRVCPFRLQPWPCPDDRVFRPACGMTCGVCGPLSNRHFRSFKLTFSFLSRPLLRHWADHQH